MQKCIYQSKFFCKTTTCLLGVSISLVGNSENTTCQLKKSRMMMKNGIVLSRSKCKNVICYHPIYNSTLITFLEKEIPPFLEKSMYFCHHIISCYMYNIYNLITGSMRGKLFNNNIIFNLIRIIALKLTLNTFQFINNTFLRSSINHL